MSEWKSIESAPRGPAFLAYVDGEIRLAGWGKTSHIPMYGWVLLDQGAENCDLCNPTHWMPLPPPPETAP